MTKSKRKSVILPVVLIILSLGIIIGTTLAYFTDTRSSQSPVNFGKIEISVDDAFTESISLTDALPGDKITDKISFSKAVDSEPMYVRAKITYTTESQEQAIQDLVKELNNYDLNMLQESNSGYKWSDRYGDFYYLLDVDTSNVYNLNTLEEITITNGFIIPRELEQRPDFTQYFETIKLVVEIQAIQSTNLDIALESVDLSFFNKFGESIYTDPSLFTFEGNSLTGLTTEGKELSRIVIPSSYSILDTVTEDYKFQNRDAFDEFRRQVVESEDWELERLLMEWEMDRMMQGKDDEWPATFTKTISTTYGYGDDVNITTIRGAFLNNNYLKTIIIPNSVTSIGNSAFRACSSLTSITIPDSVTSIGWYAFYECSSLTSVSLGNSVMSIGLYAFQECSSLTSITIPDSVTSIGERVFTGCESLISIIVDDANTTYDSRDNCNAIIEKETNTLIAGCQNTIIPHTVKSIGEYAFRGCSSLTSITIPDSVTSIGDDAFYGCSGLTSISIPDSVTSIGEWAFYYCSGLTSVSLGNKVTSIGQNAFDGCSGLTGALTIPDSVTSIGDSAFYKCDGLTSVSLGNSVTSIGDDAFYLCSGLTSIIIPDSVTSIVGDAFYGCYKLVQIRNLSGQNLNELPRNVGQEILTDETSAFTNTLTNEGKYQIFVVDKKKYLMGFTAEADRTTADDIPSDITDIYQYAFVSCSSLTGALTIPDSVTSIGDSAFDGCSGLTGDIIIPDGVTSIGDRAFFGCSGLTSVSLGDNVKSIGEEAFRGCRSLTSVSLGNSVTSIGWEAFNGCYKLVQIRNLSGRTLKGLPNNVGQEILTDKTSAFTNTLTNEGKYQIFVVEDKKYLMGFTAEADGTTADDIPSDITDIYPYAFCECSSLTSIIIPDSVTSIGEYAFSFCSSLTSVSFGDSVTSIGDRAFAYCSGLTGALTIPDSVTSIGSYAFNGCDKLTSIIIPDSVTSIGYSAFSNCSSLTSVTIGSGATSIGRSAFASCSKLTSVNFENTTGWYVTTTEGATSGTTLDSNNLADTSTAATYLRSDYSGYYWYRS